MAIRNDPSFTLTKIARAVIARQESLKELDNDKDINATAASGTDITPQFRGVPTKANR